MSCKRFDDLAFIAGIILWIAVASVPLRSYLDRSPTPQATQAPVEIIHSELAPPAPPAPLPIGGCVGNSITASALAAGIGAISAITVNDQPMTDERGSNVAGLGDNEIVSPLL